jgi:proline racemase
MGFVIMESDFYVPMSGTNTICTVTALLETGIIPMQEPVTRFNLEAPAGLVAITATCKDGKCQKVAFRNVPSFVFALDRPIEVEGLGTVTVDVAYGGMIYCLVDAPALGFAVTSDEGADLVEVGERIKAAAAVQIPCVHPENPEIHTINQTLFACPLERGPNGPKAKNTVVVSPGRLDRSPCGTGTSARLAVMRARRQIEVGETFTHESVIGTFFEGKVLEDTVVAGQPAIVPEIAGPGWITAFHQYVLDPSDPFPTGYRVGDMWRMGPRQLR